MIEFPNINDTLAQNVRNLNDSYIPVVTLKPTAKQLFEKASGFREKEDGGLGFNKEYFEQLEREQAEDIRRKMISAPVMKVRATNNHQLAEQINTQLTVQREAFNKTEQKNDNTFVDTLIGSVFNEEGGYSNDKKDTGNYYKGQFVGTNHGVSAPILAEFLGRAPTVEDMKNLKKEDARGIYKANYYDRFGIGSLPKNLQEITLHSVVNSGGHGAKVIQKMLGVAEDGVIGPKTREAMKDANFSRQEFADELLKKYKTFKTWDTHGEGWSNRFNRLAE
jgi:hypothetical protein